MLYDESTAPSLRPWLVRSLQPICDADPEALADYVLALLKHDAAEPELRKMFVGQLEEFLEKEAPKFVDALFSALRTKSYLPYESVKAEPSDGGIPIPFDSLLSPSGLSDRSKKRGLEGEEHEHPLPKGPRLGGGDGHFPRYSPSSGRMHGQGRGMGRRGGHMNGRGIGGDGSPPMNGQIPSDGQTYRPPGGGFGGMRRRGICRDYYNNGFCARGSLCQYSHGDDAVIPPMPFANGPGLPNMAGGMPFIPIFGNGQPFGGMAGGAYDPHESHMEMGFPLNRGSDRHVIAPRPGEDGGTADHVMKDAMPSSSGELPVIQDLTPRDPVEEAMRGETSVQSNGFTHNFGRPRRTQHSNISPRGNGPLGFGGRGGMMGNVGVGMGGKMGGGGGEMDINMGGMGGFQRPGRGTFSGENHAFRNGARDDKTLVVEKVPQDKLTLEAVNDWFKRFGTVTNVAIDSAHGKALVSFSNHGEAHAAWKSEEAVFGNRFVKLFWHRPMEGQGRSGQMALAASAPLVKNIATQDSSAPLQQHALPQPQQASTSSTPSKLQKPDPATIAALAARQQLLEKQISEQKVLMSRLSTASSAEEKQEIMARIRSIQNDLKPSTPTLPEASTSKLSNGSSTGSLSEKERLDKELELHNAQNALDSDRSGTEAASTEALREKLERLKAEASRIGLPESEINAGSASNSSPYRPYRGRGFRARGYFRGRGGPPRASMKLDNRPRKLLIQGVPANDEAVQAVGTHFQNMGSMESFGAQGEGEVVVQFWSRSAAENALASGTDIPSVGNVKISWYTGTAPSVPSHTSEEASSLELKGQSEVKTEDDARADLEDGGWGHSYDDEDEGRRRRSRSRSFS